LLARKVDAGADVIITQHFFDNNIFLKFADDCQKRNINLPMIPSVMPIGNPKYLFAFSDGGNVRVPKEVLDIYGGDPNFARDNRSIGDPDTQKRAVEYTAKQLTSLRDLDSSGKIMRINTYTANNLPFMKKVLSELDLTQETSQGRS
jgi:5,10-methylenetetrahydrofolate reductase